MVLAGSTGNARTEIKRSLAKNVDDKMISTAYAWLMQELNGKPTQYTLYMANSMYVQQDMPLKQRFSQIVTQCFKSTVQLRNFKNNPDIIRLEVNRWVEQKTNSKIKDIISPGSVTRLTRLILVNAIYFKADWALPFEKRATTKRLFYTNNIGNQVDFMNAGSMFPYYEDQTMQALQLPYKNQELSMYIMLPRQRNGLNAVETALTAQKIDQIIGSMTRRRMQVALPKWKLTQNLPLKQLLKQMGMSSMFNPSTNDFTGISDQQNLFVSDALHKAFIEVNEKGTEAAAATTIVMTTTSINTDQPVPFVADHPFIFFIRHQSTKNILFLGRLVDP